MVLFKEKDFGVNILDEFKKLSSLIRVNPRRRSRKTDSGDPYGRCNQLQGKSEAPQ
jgi:hypothetical protein